MPKHKNVTYKNENLTQSFDFQVLKMLSDPMRVRIILELMIHKELSTKQLQSLIPLGRSTLGHHLQKLEENNLISVRIQQKSYSLKYYSISKSLESNFSLKKAIENSDEDQHSRIIIDAFSSLASVLQFIANIAYESLVTLRKESIEKVHKEGLNTYYSINGKENLFVPAQFSILPKHLVPDFVNTLREFIKNSSSIITDDKPLTTDDLPLYVFISTGFPIVFQNIIGPPK